MVSSCLWDRWEWGRSSPPVSRGLEGGQSLGGTGAECGAPAGIWLLLASASASTSLDTCCLCSDTSERWPGPCSVLTVRRQSVSLPDHLSVSATLREPGGFRDRVWLGLPHPTCWEEAPDAWSWCCFHTLALSTLWASATPRWGSLQGKLCELGGIGCWHRSPWALVRSHVALVGCSLGCCVGGRSVGVPASPPRVALTCSTHVGSQPILLHLGWRPGLF